MILKTEDSLKEELKDIIEQKLIKTVFQPIISLRDASIFGHEALSRGPENSAFKNPELLFNCAIKYNKLWELELLCRTKSLEALHDYNNHNQNILETKLFLNVNPSIIHDIKFKQGFTKKYLSKFSIQPDSIIFEITEKGTVDNVDDFKKTVQNYKEQNYKIAIDDAGAGLSGLNMISTIRPHYIKLDINLIRDIDKDLTKQALIRSMVEFANLSDTMLIAEGIETKEELLKLIDFGVNYGQGYFIQKPNPNILPVRAEIQEIIKESNNKKNHMLANKVSDVYIRNITTRQRTLNPNIEISKVQDMMNQDPTLPGFCIIEDNELLGVITRNRLYSLLGSQYGYSLYSKKAISTILSTEFLKVDFHNPIDKVAGIAMQRDPNELYDFVTITKDDKYYGIVTVKDLLENAIKIEVNYAKHLNPISGLPGNLLIEQYIENRLYSQDNFTLLYFDIDNFKAYNDVYGFERGDLVIKTLANIIQDTVPKNEFVGHIGGDDFVSILSFNNVTQVCHKIMERFDNCIVNFYDKSDLDRGFIIAKNRNNIEETFPLLSISISGVVNNNYCSLYEISRKASEIKKICKQKIGSICIIE